MNKGKVCTKIMNPPHSLLDSLHHTYVALSTPSNHPSLCHILRYSISLDIGKVRIK
uniref:Uncharacterized protein n=1 Tax=Utricularia reniformis TaxID=192314 RepID=A0A1Y0B227_9LAMI|nr:hypothetical protein AEK19_MT1235 [Utricularia reniformis]ART31447.1 hypothetical protein AEK19_MT1235 [Utricularia reniformis]